MTGRVHPVSRRHRAFALLKVAIGVIVACLAAPTLSFIFLLVAAWPRHVEAFARQGLGAFADTLFLWTMMLLVTLGVVFPLALALALTANALGWTARWGATGGGALIGLGFTFFMTQGPEYSLPDTILLSLAFGISGSICGWIYWRIAVYGRNREPVT